MEQGGDVSNAVRVKEQAMHREKLQSGPPNSRPDVTFGLPPSTPVFQSQR